MTVHQGPSVEVVTAAVADACRAPSIYNTQPWAWRLTTSALELFADRTRRLSVADSHGRSLLLGCGAALHHLTVAMAARGWRSNVSRLPEPRLPDLLASVRFERDAISAEVPALAAAITSRRSDRRPMSSWPVSPDHVTRMVAAAAEYGGLLRPLDDPLEEALWTSLARRVQRRRGMDQRYLDEQRQWVGDEAPVDSGLSRAGLPMRGDDGWGADAPNRFPAGDLVRPAREGEPPSSKLLLLASTSDDPLSRLRSGEALSAVVLEATRAGLASRMDSQVIEIDATRRLLEDEVLHGTRSPQILIRVGWPASAEPVPATPRRPMSDVLSIVGRPAHHDPVDAPGQREHSRRTAGAGSTRQEGDSDE